VADVREMIEGLKYVRQSARRVVIYDEAHSMSREAFNALLKTLEEPPSGVYFILVTTEPEKVPETVKSRLIEFQFRRVSAEEIYKRLTHVVGAEGKEVSSDLLSYLAQRAEGSARDALMMLDMAIRADISTVDDFKELSGEADVAPEVVQSLLTGDPGKMYAEVDAALQRVSEPMQLAAAVTACLKELLILRAGGELKYSGPRLAIRHDLALKLEAERILAALKVLWDLRTKVKTTVDPRGNLDLALILIMEVFIRGKQQFSQAQTVSAVVSEAPQKRLTLADMK
jgi:DNA polymerase-3 subunit gamma/tau